MTFILDHHQCEPPISIDGPGGRRAPWGGNEGATTTASPRVGLYFVDSASGQRRALATSAEQVTYRCGLRLEAHYLRAHLPAGRFAAARRAAQAG